MSSADPIHIDVYDAALNETVFPALPRGFPNRGPVGLEVRHRERQAQVCAPEYTLLADVSEGVAEMKAKTGREQGSVKIVRALGQYREYFEPVGWSVRAGVGLSAQAAKGPPVRAGRAPCGVKVQPSGYPDYFPQSLPNPQPAYCYPDDALPEFRE
ncbi:hypothetical protein BN961_03240 [Afipia felis]|uniref:Uncharacterized protein n=1 Tax=Afipia felis TaxID=1035 RepID=A0A090N8A7_AFIFE|nr:hypothetical protein BN961_03240 [Afipia felis]